MEQHNLYLYGEVGWELTAALLQEQIAAFGEIADDDEIIVHISSVGGGVFEGWTIGNIIAAMPQNTTAHIEGICASIATYIALKCNSVQIAETARFIIHNPSTFADGDAENMEQAAEQLDQIKSDLINVYNTKTGIAEDELSEMMDAETSFTAEEAIEKGFVDQFIEQPLKAVAKFDIKKENMSKDKETVQKAEGLLDSFAKFITNIKNAVSGEASNVMVELADGGSLFVESEDGDFTGKNVFTVDDDGNATETAAADGSYALSDNRVMVVTDGMVESVSEAPESEEDKLKDEIKDLKAQVKTLEKDKADLQAKVEASDENMQKLLKEAEAMEKEVKNLKETSAGSQEPPRRQTTTTITNKFERNNGEKDKSPSDALAQRIAKKYLPNLN